MCNNSPPVSGKPYRQQLRTRQRMTESCVEREQTTRRVTRSQSRILAASQTSINATSHSDCETSNTVVVRAVTNSVICTRTAATQTYTRRPKDLSMSSRPETYESDCPSCHHLVRFMQEEISGLVKTNKVRYNILLMYTKMRDRYYVMF